MEKINEITIPEGVDRIAVKQYDDKIVIEFIPEKRKFKAGDSVTLKSGCCTSNSSLIYHSKFDEYIGKKLIVIDYTKSGNIECNNGFYFHEDWLEPWSDEPKKGDLAIFWDYSKDVAIMRTYREKKGMLHYDSVGYQWKNSIKFESKEQFEKVLRGEI